MKEFSHHRKIGHHLFNKRTSEIYIENCIMSGSLKPYLILYIRSVGNIKMTFRNPDFSQAFQTVTETVMQSKMKVKRRRIGISKQMGSLLHYIMTIPDTESRAIYLVK